MSEGTLALYDLDPYIYRLAWYFEDEGDFGGVLGDGKKYTERDLEKAKGEDRELVLAEITAQQTENVQRDDRGYFWESKKDALGALRACKAAIKNDTGAPWPEWAIKAQAAGWKAPKGWKP